MKFCKHTSMCGVFNAKQPFERTFRMRCKCPFYEEEDEDHEGKELLSAHINDRLWAFYHLHSDKEIDFTQVMTKPQLQKLKRVLEE